MKDPTVAIFTAIYQLLNQNIKVSGKDLPVYSVVPDAVENGYIFIDSFNPGDSSTKSAFMVNGTVQIQVVMPVEGSKGSRKEFEQYCNEVLTTLIPTLNSKLNLGNDFENTYLYLQNKVSLSNEPLETGRYFRNIYTLFLEVEQLN